MGSVSVPTAMYIAAATAAASAAVSAYGAHQQGVAVANEDKQKARTEQQSATQKQIDMRQRMLASLATQNANTLGAIGTGRGTGFAANTNRQIREQQNDLLANSANASAQISLLDQEASNAVAAGNTAAAGDVVSGIGSAFSAYGASGTPAGGGGGGGPGFTSVGSFGKPGM